MDRDLHSPAGGYGVWSFDYGSPQLRFYWEKIEGLKFRRKLRIRHYGNLDAATEDSPVCVEIKRGTSASSSSPWRSAWPAAPGSTHWPRSTW